jgi:cytochrome oxidase Cu insertion factor (SCO1/SenC/PrrC family)
MRAMRALIFIWLTISMAPEAVARSVTEEEFRRMLKVAPAVALRYRDIECRPIAFSQFVEAMQEKGVGSEIERSAEGDSVTATIHRRGTGSCPSPYPPVTRLPSFDLRDLDGKRVTSASLRGKPTLINFYFAKCVPCILEVGPLNTYAASRRDMNFLAVTFDEPTEARAFMQRFGFRWRIVPDARDFIDRMRVKQYPLMALFDADGRLLGTKRGGARDELEAAAVLPQLTRWVDGLQRAQKPAGR